MSQDVEKVIEAIQALRFLPESERTEYYDSAVEPLVEQIGSLVRKQHELEDIKSWLSIQSSTLDFAVEGITDITFELSRKYPEELKEAVSALPKAQQSRILRLLGEFDGIESLPAEVVSREAALTSERLDRLSELLGNTPRSATGVLGDFVGTDTLTSARGFPIIHGTLTVFARDGSELGGYKVNSGGGSPSYRTTNGPLPPGLFRVSNYRPNRTTAGMVLHGIGYSFDLDPTDGTQVFGRSLFRIHPDGNNEGTNGCLGVRETAERLRDCESHIVDLFRDGAFKISVRY